MAKQLNVALNIGANTNQAKQALNELKKILTEIQTSRTITVNDTSLQEAKQAAADLKFHLEQATSVNTGKLNLGAFSQSLKKSGQDLNTLYNQLSSIGPQGQKAFLSLTQSIVQADHASLTLGNRLSALGTTLANTMRWQLSSSLLHSFIGALQSAYGYAQDLNKSLNNIRIVTGKSIDDMAAFATEANKAAQALNVSTTGYTDAALIYYQQGIRDQKEIAERVATTVKLANVSRQSAEEVSSQMTAIWNNFYDGTKSLEYYADVITALGAATASSSEEISQGLQKFAAVADTVGLSYEKATAALATVVAETRQSADVVGTAFKTMFARFQGLSLGKTLEDGVNLNKYSKALATIGVNILDANGELRVMDEILDDTAEKWNQISEAQRVALAETVAGTRQYAQFMAIMNNYDKIRINQAIGENSTGTLQEQQDIYAEGWEAASKRVKTALEGITQQLLDDHLFIGALRGIEKVITTISGAINGLGGLKTILLAIGTIITQKYASEMPAIMQKLVGNFNVLTGAAEKQRVETIKTTDAIIQEMQTVDNSNHAFNAQVLAMKYASAMTTDLEKRKKSLSQAEIEAYQSKIKEVELYGQVAAAIGAEIDALEKEKMAKSATINSELHRNGSLTTPQEDVVVDPAELAQIDEYRVKIQEAEEELANLQELQAHPVPGTNMKQLTADIDNCKTKTEELRVKLDQLNSQTKTGAQLVQEFKDAAKNAGTFNNVLNQALSRTQTWRKALSSADSSKISQANKEIEEYVAIMEKAGLKTDAFRDKTGKINTDTFLTQLEDQTSGLWGQLYDTETLLANLHDKLVELNVSPEALNQLEQVMRKLGATSPELAAALEQLRAKFSALPQHAFSLSESLARVGSIVMSVSMAMNAFKNIGNIFDDESLSTGEQLIQMMTSLGMLLPAINALLSKQNLEWARNTVETIKNAFAKKGSASAAAAEAVAEGADAGAKVANTVATKGLTAAIKGLWASLWPLLAVMAAVTAAMLAFKAIISLIKKARENSAEGQLKQAKKDANELKEELEQTTSAAQTLRSEFDNYKTVLEKLKECTVGTSEWREQLQKAKEETEALLAKYPQLLLYKDSFDSNGLINPDTLDKVLDIENNRVALLQYATLSATGDVAKKDVAVKQKDYDFAMYDSGLNGLAGSILLNGEQTRDIHENRGNYTEDDIYKIIGQNDQRWDLYTSSAIEAVRNNDDFYNSLSDIEKNMLDNIADGLVNEYGIGSSDYDELFDKIKTELTTNNTDYNSNAAYWASDEYLNTLVSAAQTNEYTVQSVNDFLSALDQITTATELAAQQISGVSAKVSKAVLGADASSTEVLVGAQEYQKARDQWLNDHESVGNTENDDNEEALELVRQYLKSLGYDASVINAASYTSEKKDGKYQYTISAGGVDLVKDLDVKTIRSSVAAAVGMEAAEKAPELVAPVFDGLSDGGKDLSNKIADNMLNNNGNFNAADFLGDLTEAELEQVRDLITKSVDAQSHLTGTTTTGNVLDLLGGFTSEDINAIAPRLGLGGGADVMAAFKDAATVMAANMPDLGTHSFDASQMTYSQQRGYVQARDAAFASLDKQGVDETTSNFLKYLTWNSDASGIDLTAFLEGVSQIDVASVNASAQLEELAEKYHISGVYLDYFKQDLDDFPKHINHSTEAIEKEAESIGKIIKDGLKIGDTIKPEDYKTLETAGVEVDKYFTKMADGTYQLTAAAEEFNKAARQATTNKLVDKANEYTGEASLLASKYNLYQDASVSDEKNAFLAHTAVTGATTSRTTDKYGQARLEYIQANSDLFADTNIEGAASVLSAATEGFDPAQQSEEFLAAMNAMMEVINQAELEQQGMALSGAQDFREFNNILEQLNLTADVIGEKAYYNTGVYEMLEQASSALATTLLNNATTLDELDGAADQVAQNLGSIDYNKYAEALMNMASQYENCAIEAEEYQRALESGNTAELAAAEDRLKASVMAGEAAKSYGLEARSIEAQASALKELHPEMKLSSQMATQMAINNQRLNKGVTTLNKNFATWRKNLAKDKKGTKDYADAVVDITDAIADLVGAEENFELPEGFLDSKKNLDDIAKAANGDVDAINRLGIALAAAQINALQLDSSLDLEVSWDDQKLADMKTEFQTFCDGLAEAAAQGADKAQQYLDTAAMGTGQSWISALNEMALQTGMSVDQMNGLLSKMGVTAEVKSKAVKQTVSVPTYDEYSQVIWDEPATATYEGIDGSQNILVPQFHKRTWTVQGPDVTTEGYVNVASIGTVEGGGAEEPKAYYTGTGGGNLGGGVSPSSTAGSGGGGTKKSAASHKHSVNRYSNEENTASGLAKVYDRISEAKDHAFGAERINLMQKELTTLGKLKDAAAGYLAAIVGQGNVDKIVKAVYSGKNIGDMIKSGELGGTIAADFKSLFSGLDAAGKQLEYQVKDAAGNTSLKEEGYDLNAIQALFGESLNIELDSYGNIKNRDDIMNMLDRWNNGVEDWFSGISDTATEADENEKARRLAMIEAIRERIEQYGETAELIQDKVDEYLEQIYEMQQKNADIIAGKMEKQIRLTENELALLQNSIKLMGKNMYKTQKGMEDWFAAVWTTPVEEREKSAQAAKTAGEEAMAAWHKWQADEFNTEGINSEQALDIIASSRDAIQEAFDGIFEGIDEMSEHMGNTLDYWNDKIDKVTSAMEANASTLEHLQNVLGLLGRSADYKALGEILKGQLSVAEDQYTGAKTKAESSVSAYKQAYEEYKKLLAEDKQEAEWFKENNALDVLQAQMIEDVAAKQAALENVLEKVNAWFENEINRIYQESEDRLTGEWGSFDELDAAMQRQHNLADEYLTKTNQLYETGTLLRKLAQDIDKTDSAAAKAKLKAFSDEIELMKEQEQLNKTDLEIAKARYELLLAEIALEEAQNAKSTVRLQRDSEGNYGYVYTADQDKVADAEQNLADKQNDLYNLVLGQTQDYNEKIIQHTKERNEALADLDRKWLNGEITDEEEYHRIRQDITEKYNDLLEADYHSYYEAVKWLNLVGAEGQTEAWTNSFSNILYSQDTYAQKLEAESDNISSEIDKDMEWLNSQRDYYTEEAKVGNEELKGTIDEVTDANKALLEQLIGKDGKSGLVGGMSSATSAAINLTSAFASQYTQALETAKGYQEMLQALQAYEREILNFEGHNTGGDEGGGKSYTAYSKDGAQYTIGSERGIDFVENAKAGDTITGGDGSTWVKNSDGSVLISKNGVEYLYGASWPGEPAAPTVQQPTQPATPSLEKGQSVTVKTTATNFTRDGGYGTRMQSWVPGYTFTVMGVSGDEVLIGLNGQVTGWVRKSDLVGFRSGGYTGEFGNDGKLAMLHEKELVLNAADTENLLDAITIIREISSAIDLRAAAANMAATLASPGYGTQAQEIQQTVTIHAEFPNATDHTEIEEAFNTLINQATQYVARPTVMPKTYENM